MRSMWRRMSTWGRRTLGAFRAALISISDPAISRLFGVIPSYAGVEVTEATLLGLSAVYRALNLISGTLAQLPMPTKRETAKGVYQTFSSFLDNPGMFRVANAPISLTPFAWKRMVFVHLGLYNEAYLKHIYNGAGALLGLQPIHPLSVQVWWPRPEDRLQPAGGKWFRVVLEDGTIETHDASSLTQVLGFTLDGLRGVWISTIAKNSLGVAIAGDRAAAKLYSSGATVAGVVTPDDEWADGDAKLIRNDINDAMTGWENAGGIAVMNRKLKFTQLGLSAVDAQFLEGRQFSIEEVARWFGIPPFELMQTDKQTSWGTGIEAQQRGLGRGNLAPWAKCLEEVLSGLLPMPRFVAFDFTALERPSPDREQELALARWDSGVATQNETRIALGLDPVAGGDVFKGAAAAPPPADVSRETGAPADA